ncbi:MAG TPA: hypothetical protein VFQ16_01750 [Burkholderiaceae bacterium]|nr:hypothetical protein [Burkholderiaceae bacterium]
MTPSSRRSARALLPLGIASALFGLAVSWMVDEDVVLPARESLAVHSGAVKELHRGRSALRLRLAGDERTFRYLSKAGEMGRVHDALRDAAGPMVTVHFDPSAPWTPVGEDTALYTVYELSVAGRFERRYEQVLADWRADEGTGRWVGGVFLVVGGVLIVRALAARR